MSGGSRRGGVDRMMSKLKTSIQNKNYYEAHQMYRTLYFRYICQRKFDELECLLFDGAQMLFAENQVESGVDLTKLYIETLKEGLVQPEEKYFQKISKLYQLIPDDNVDKAKFLSDCVRWSSTDERNATGHPRLHQHLAYAHWQKRQYSESRHHFLHSCDGVGCGSMLVEFHTTRGFSSEVDLFITQTVLQYLCLKKHIVAAVAFATYTEVHPKISKGPPYSNPLLNFIWLLLVAINSSNESISMYSVLCDKYKLFIQRDPQYFEYLDKIGQVFFKIPPPQQNPTMFSGLLNSLMNAMTEDSDEEEYIGVPPQAPSPRNRPSERGTIQQDELD